MYRTVARCVCVMQSIAQLMEGEKKKCHLKTNQDLAVKVTPDAVQMHGAERKQARQ